MSFHMALVFQPQLIIEDLSGKNLLINGQSLVSYLWDQPLTGSQTLDSLGKTLDGWIPGTHEVSSTLEAKEII